MKNKKVIWSNTILMLVFALAALGIGAICVANAHIDTGKVSNSCWEFARTKSYSEELKDEYAENCIWRGQMVFDAAEYNMDIKGTILIGFGSLFLVAAIVYNRHALAAIKDSKRK